MSSRPCKKIETTVESIIEKLDERILKKKFDEPVDMAAKNFKYESKEKPTRKQLQKLFSDYIREICRNGTKTLREDYPAYTIWLLDENYQGDFSNGYNAAILDAANGGPDRTKKVLHRIAEIIKTDQRQKYISSVFTASFDITDWNLKSRIAEYLLSSYKDYFPEGLQECRPAQIIDEIPYLLSIIANSRSVLNHTLNSL